jgi:hypothetical protein
MKYFSTMYCIFPFFIYIFVLELYFYNKVMKKINIRMRYLIMILTSSFIFSFFIYRLAEYHQGLPESSKSEWTNNAPGRKSGKEDSCDILPESSVSLMKAGNINIFQLKNIMTCIP